MSKKVIYWLGAVDGTSSQKHTMEDASLRTHIMKIWQKFDNVFPQQKYYSHGPNVIGVTSRIDLYRDGFKDGGSSKSVFNDVFNAFKRFLKKIKFHTDEGTVNTEIEVRVCLIGFSRGAVICMDLVKRIYDKFKIKTYFLGLLDPVQRDFTLNGEIFYSYIDNHFITRRNLNTDRQWMGWAGLHKSTISPGLLINLVPVGFLYAKEFLKGKIYNTTHGGMGGYFTSSGYCKLIEDLMRVETIKDSKQYEYYEIQTKLNYYLQSNRVYYDLLDECKSLGVPLRK